MDITHDFADERFRQWILDHFCNERGSIQVSDIDHVTSLQLANHHLTNLTGIEHFSALEELDCSYNQFIELDLSHNKRLKSLNAKENQLLSLDLSANSDLEMLDCSFNRLRALKVNNNLKLVTLECHWNLLSKLDVEHNPHLKELSCSYNALFTLELHQNKRLERLECASNYISHLDITSCVNLEEIRCNHNHLTALDISHNPELKSIRCFNNHITKLDISHNEQLEELYCSENKLTELDSKQNPKLERLQYADNLITEPDCMVPGVGIFQYNASLINYNVTVPYKGKELVVTASVPTKAAMAVLTPVIEEAWKHFDELTEQTLQLIGEAHPDEDVNELLLTEVEFQEGGYFRVGYDAGDTPAGRLCLYAEFDGKLQMSERLIYESY